MESLVEIKNNQVVVSSRQVAENFGKYHKDILETVAGILAAENSATRFFQKSTFINRGKEYPEYLMNRDGFSLLVMGFTGKKALEWKIKYIQAFNDMEKRLKEQPIIPRISEQELALRKQELNLEEKKLEKEKSELLLRIADRIPNELYKSTLESLAVATLTGKEYLPLPKVTEKYYTTEDLSRILSEKFNTKVSGAIIGRLANQHNLKTEEYAIKVWNKAKGCERQVESYRYKEAVIEPLCVVYEVYLQTKKAKRPQ